MKKILYILTVSMLLGSCDSFLDTTPDDLKSPEKMFETEQSTEGVLLQAYGLLREDAPWTNWSSYAGSSNADADYCWDNHKNLNSGLWGAIDKDSRNNKWELFYRGIREATYFMQNLDRCTVINTSTRERWRAEARCLRAYYYANLMRHYGPVVLLGDDMVDINKPVEELMKARSSWDECIEWVIGEFDAVIDNPYLPDMQQKNYWARMSKTIAMAYKSRLLLQSASKQFNGNRMYSSVKNADGKSLFPTNYDPSKWETAAKSAKDLIDLGFYKLVVVTDNNGKIDPFKSYKDVFITNQNSEMIFPYLEWDGHMDTHSAPRRNKGWGGFGVTQEMVDLYAMESGIYPITGYTDQTRDVPTIDPTANYKETGFSSFTHPISGVDYARISNMYIDREPRFYVSVLFGGIHWFIPNKESERILVEMYKGGGENFPKYRDAYTTGYAMIKFVMPTYECDPRRNARREMPYMRYAEVLLNYIEATIESGKLDDADMFTYWNDLRARAGLRPILEAYPSAVGNYTKLLELVRRERRIELAFEAHTFFDHRRWLVGEKEESGWFHRMNTTSGNGGKEGEGEYPDDFFQRARLENRVFTSSFYLYPLQQKTIEKNPLLIQNYNW